MLCAAKAPGRRLPAPAQNSTEVAFDAGLAERAQMIAAHRGAHGGAAQVAVFRQRFRLVERQHHLVGQAERQAERGVDFCRQRGMKTDRFVGDQIGRHGDDHLVRGQRALRSLDPHSFSRMIDQADLAIERQRTCAP